MSMKCPCQSCKHNGVDEKCPSCWLKWINYEQSKPAKEQRYSEPIMDVLMYMMGKYLEKHETWQLLSIVSDAVASNEQE